MARLSNLYLLCYNSVQAFGWYVSPLTFFHLLGLTISLSHKFGPKLINYRAVSLYKLLSAFIATASFNQGYASAGELICRCFSFFLFLFYFCGFFYFFIFFPFAGLLQAAAFLEVIHGAIGGFFFFFFFLISG